MINSQIPFNKLSFLRARELSFGSEAERQRQNCIHALGELKGYSEAFANEGLMRLLRLTEARQSFELDGHAVSLLRLYEADASENHLDDDLCMRIIQLVYDYDSENAEGIDSMFPDSFFRRQTEKYRSRNDVPLKSYFTNLTLYTPPSGSQNLNNYRQDLDAFFTESLRGFDLRRISALHYQIRAVSPFNDLNGVAARISSQILLQRFEAVNDWVFLSLAIAEEKELYQTLMRESMVNGDLSSFDSFMIGKIQEGALSKLRLLKRIRRRMQRTSEIIDKYTAYNLPPVLKELIYESIFIKTADLTGRLKCHRQTAYTYLNHLVNAGILIEKRSGREKLYFHKELFDLLSN